METWTWILNILSCLWIGHHLWQDAKTTWRRGVSFWLWSRQGFPTDEPVVVKPGIVAACPHGHGLITEFTWDTSHMPGDTVDGGVLFDRYSSRYGVQRVGYLDGCSKCRT